MSQLLSAVINRPQQDKGSAHSTSETTNCWLSENLPKSILPCDFDIHGHSFLREAQNGALIPSGVTIFREPAADFKDVGESDIREIIIETYHTDGRDLTYHFSLSDEYLRRMIDNADLPPELRNLRQFVRTYFEQVLFVLASDEQSPRDYRGEIPLVSEGQWKKALRDLHEIQRLSEMVKFPVLEMRKYQPGMIEDYPGNLDLVVPERQFQTAVIPDDPDREHSSSAKVAEALESWLDEHGVSRKDWGKKGARTILQLAREISSGDATIYAVESDSPTGWDVIVEGPVAVLDATCKLHTSDHQPRKLVEFNTRIRSDDGAKDVEGGRVTLAGKPAEKGWNGIRQLLGQELGIDAHPKTLREAASILFKGLLRYPGAKFLAAQVQNFVPDSWTGKARELRDLTKTSDGLELDPSGTHRHFKPSKGYPGLFERRIYTEYKADFQAEQYRPQYEEHQVVVKPKKRGGNLVVEKTHVLKWTTDNEVRARIVRDLKQNGGLKRA